MVKGVSFATISPLAKFNLKQAQINRWQQQQGSIAHLYGRREELGVIE
jgi:hypothetical protein